MVATMRRMMATIIWIETAAFAVLLGGAAVATDGRAIIPVPSAPQFRYQSTDFVALIHFNMATYARDGDPGCDATNWNQKAPNATGPTKDPSTFAPSLLNTTQWFDSITALGANIAVLTAKHGCGFLLWPTTAVLPVGDAGNATGSETFVPYGYHTRFDILRQFVDSAKASGVGYGFYYSIMKNFFLCRSFEGENSCGKAVLDGQHNVSDASYHTIVEHHLTELYTSYGPLTEVWIDSRLQGFGPLLDRLQPTAAGVPSHPRQWCGTESGYPSRDVGPGPVWQTGTGFRGNASSGRWVDKFCDPQLFEDHIWFYEPGRAIKPLAEMIAIYHDVVGRGMVMELAFAIGRDGLVQESHERGYRALGDWVRGCYGTPLWSVSDRVPERDRGVYTLELPVPEDAFGGGSDYLDWRSVLSLFDRIVLREDVSVGQRIRNYTVALVGQHHHHHHRYPFEDSEPVVLATLVSDGTSVGRKRIHLLDQSRHSFPRVGFRASNASILLTVTHAIAPPHIALFGVYKPCYPHNEPGRSEQS